MNQTKRSQALCTDCVRSPADGDPQPGQALTPSEAVRAATVTAAASLHAPGAGGLAPGEIADFVICDGDPFQHGTRIIQTWIGGTPVWQHKNGQHKNVNEGGRNVDDGAHH